MTLLAQRPWKVKELADELGESLALTSSHLKVLRACNLVEERREGREVWCRVRGGEVVALLAALGKAASVLLPEMRELLRDREEDPLLLKNVSLPHFYEEVMAEKVELLDLRPHDEFRAGHFPKARSYPLSEFQNLDWQGVGQDKPVVLYCRGPWCDMGPRGVRMLSEQRIEARRLAAGVVEWQAEDLPLVVEP